MAQGEANPEPQPAAAAAVFLNAAAPFPGPDFCHAPENSLMTSKKYLIILEMVRKILKKGIGMGS